MTYKEKEELFLNELTELSKKHKIFIQPRIIGAHIIEIQEDEINDYRYVTYNIDSTFEKEGFLYLLDMLNEKDDKNDRL